MKPLYSIGSYIANIKLSSPAISAHSSVTRLRFAFGVLTEATAGEGRVVIAKDCAADHRARDHVGKRTSVSECVKDINKRSGVFDAIVGTWKFNIYTHMR